MFIFKGKQAGFTLLEIVIVLTIIGFLLAMIAPRLGNIGTSAVEIIDDSNVKDMKGYIMVYQQKNARLPNKPITIINSSGGGNYQLPLIDDGDGDNGPETIGDEFNERLKPMMHILNEQEANEIKKMGIKKMMVLNDYVGSTNTEYVKDGENSDLTPQTFAGGDAGRPLNMVGVHEGLGVLMIGAFANNTGGNVRSVISRGDHLGNPSWIYRIVLGIGKNSSLVADGVVANEGLSPRGMQNKDYNTYNNYCMVLPRLKATVARIGGGEVKEIKVADSNYNEDDEQAEQNVIDLSEKQELWEVDVCSPLGYKWPKDAVDVWNIVEITNNF
ncbi:MAG: type II secretion system protein [Thermodesulfobacteriota bacterium]|nr:type II secretion system protein [Thermodesulfobacteriota bacterium]